MGAPLGNNNNTKNKPWADSLKLAMARRAEGDYRVQLAKIADVVVEKALDGDKDAWKEIADRMDGKTAQSVTVAGDQENPIQARIIVEYVKAAGGLPVPPST